jgi:hypothetical protein
LESIESAGHSGAVQNLGFFEEADSEAEARGRGAKMSKRLQSWSTQL